MIENLYSSIEFIELESKDRFKINMRFIKGKTPRGYQRPIGSITIDRADMFVAESCIHNPKLRGIGLGKWLYEYALIKYGTLRTDYRSASYEAQYVWQSLSKKYKYETEFFRGILTLFSEPIHGENQMENATKEKTFQEKLTDLINHYSKENESNTPDFILAQYMIECLRSFSVAINAREKWYGRENVPVSDPK